MSYVTGSLSLVTRQDDAYSLDLISGFLDVQPHCLFECVRSDINLKVRIFEKMLSVCGPHTVSEGLRYFLAFFKFYLNACTFHTVPNVISLLMIVSTLRACTVGRLHQFHQSLCSGFRVETCGPTGISIHSFFLLVA
jgi:hypothetical protein